MLFLIASMGGVPMERVIRPRTIRFGAFEVDLRSGELFKVGRKVRIEAQPFRLLTVLLEKPGELVTRNDLKQGLWPQDTFVDFDHSLNVDIQRLRLALGDSADNPRFIETLPRRGYRFICPVEISEETASQQPAHVSKPHYKRWSVWVGATGAVVLTALGVYWMTRPVQIEFSLAREAVPLTAYPGRESFPSFSPDGNLVAFSWSGEKQENWDIYIKQIGSESLRRLTTHPDTDFSPVISPDGQYIAFLRGKGVERTTLLRMPLNGGPEQTLTDVLLPEGELYIRPGPYLAWLPDGTRMIIVDKDSPQDPAGLYLFSLNTREKRRLTRPPVGAGDDDGPAISPDGRWLAFSRGTEISRLYVLELTGDLSPEGEPKQITNVNQHANSPVWTPDGREIVFSMGLYLEHSLYRMRISGGKANPPERLTYAGEGAWYPAISHHGNRLAFMRWVGGGSEIWRAEVPTQTKRAAPPVRLVWSTKDDEEPEYSPDGRQIVFKSNRSGRLEIWACGHDGTNPSQLTFRAGENTFLPRWSPDGRHILFTSNPDGNNDLFLIDSEGGPTRRLTSEPSNEVAAVFSHDGRWIYFHSDRTGRREVWKMPVEADGNCGPAVQVTRNGGISPEESPDDRFLYYLKEGTPRSLWRIPTRGGEEAQVLPSVLYDNFTVADDGIYFIQSPSQNRYSLDFFDLATSKTSTILEPVDPGWGLTVSPGPRGAPRSILYVQCRPNDSDLMLVNDFQ